MDNTITASGTMQETDAPETFVPNAYAIQPGATALTGTDDDIEIARANVERTRTNLGETLSALQEKLDPQTLMAQAKETVVEATTEAVSGAVGEVRGAVGDAVTATQDAFGSVLDSTKKAGSTVKEFAAKNPIETALLLGAGWWLLSSLTSSRRSSQRRWESERHYGYNGGYNAYPPSYGYNGPYGPPQESRGVAGTLADAARAVVPAAVAAGTAMHLYHNSGQGSATGEGVAASASKTLENATSAISDTLHTAGHKAGDAVESAKDAIGGAVGSAKDAVGSAVGSAKDAVGSTVSSVRDALGSAATTVKQSAGQASHAAGELMGTVSENAKSVGTSALETIRANPIPAAAWALGIGVTIALLLPDTEAENRLVGKTRDSLLDTAQQSAGELLDKVQNVSSKTFEAVTDTVKQEAKQQGLTV